jgi:TonB-linked SusC/RagA family outer membrane protein
MKKRYFLWIIMIIQLFVFQSAYAQKTGVITGVVKDQSGEPIIGASIIVSGATNGTVTDINGRFSLNASTDAILKISYIGYKAEIVKVNNRSSVSVTLTEDLHGLDEVVVVGYGTQKKVNLTGSIAAVSGRDLTKRPVMNTTSALQGLASGVTVTSTSGQPGKEGSTIMIRGIGTLNNNNPLVLVDGVVGSVDGVSPSDIESISILKDAASSAVYGSRAANGVILITTKRAGEGKIKIGLNTNIGFQTVTTQPNFLGSIDYMELYDKANSNDTRNVTTGAAGGVIYGEDYIANYKAKMTLDPYNYPNTDWQAITYKQQAIQQIYNLSLSGGTDKVKTLASANYSNQEGVFPDTYMKRYSARINTDYKFNNKLSAGVDFSGRHTIVSEPGSGASAAIGSVRRTASIYPWVTPTGNPAYVQIGANSWALSQEKFAGYNRNLYDEGVVNLKMAYAPIKELRFDVSYSPRINYSNNKVFSDIITYYDVDNNPITNAQTRAIKQTYNYSFNDDLKFLVNYEKNIKSHNIHLLGGFQQNTYYGEYLYGRREGSDFSYDEIASFPVTNQSTDGNASEMALQSFFGRLNYAYANKYLLEANVRYDGSSRFADGHRWGMFPSFSAGWRINEESFMKNIDWISNTKLRASWGRLGNQEVGSYYPSSLNISLSQPVVFNGTVSDGYGAVNYAFKDISWETTTMSNIGLDLGFFKNQLTVAFEYYQRTTSGILMNLDIPSYMGYGNSPLQNAGVIENKGWELNVDYNNHIGNVNYNISANLSDVRNKIVDMKGITNDYSDIFTSRAGYSYGTIWGLQADGLFPTTTEAKAYTVTQFGNLQGGDIKYVDQKTVDTDGDGRPDAGDGIINSKDYVAIGNTIPRYTYSFNISAEYKKFDIQLFFQGVGKCDGYLQGDLAWAFNNGANVQQWQKDGMWTEGQTNSKYTRMFISSANNIKTSTFWLQDASYLRLKNLQLGYTLPKKILNSISIDNLRVYFSANNLFTFSKMIDGYDPEQSPTNAQTSVPLLRTFSFGFNLNF